MYLHCCLFFAGSALCDAINGMKWPIKMKNTNLLGTKVTQAALWNRKDVIQCIYFKSFFDAH
jgi:cystathionine beta-lyase family protein involved in aluminum resistance